MSAGLLGAVVLTASLLSAPTSQAAVLSIDTAGIVANGKFGNPTNTMLDFEIGANSHVTGIGYDVNLTAFDPSYLSDVNVSFTTSDPTLGGVFLSPGFQDSNPGTASYNSGGIIDLVGSGPDFNVGSDGTLRVEFFENFQYNLNPSGRFNSGTFDVQYSAVPEPSTWALLGLSSLGMGVVVLRHRQRAA